MTDSDVYGREVRQACRAAIEGGATTWREILHQAQGADPPVVFAALAARMSGSSWNFGGDPCAMCN
ncbi:MAG: hypothetical protein ACYDHH_23585 [Solirubrobacteraceae bacterium]